MISGTIDQLHDQFNSPNSDISDNINDDTNSDISNNKNDDTNETA